MSSLIRGMLTLALVVAVALACGDAADTSLSDTAVSDSTETPSDTEPTVTPTTAVPSEPVPTLAENPTAAPTQPAPTAAPTAVVRPPAPNGFAAPAVATTALELAAQITAAETGLRDPDTTAAERNELGHLHQVAIRRLGYEPAWDAVVFEALPAEFVEPTLLHVSARRALIDLRSGYDAADFIPAWEIIEPEQMDQLLIHYQAAEAATGIEWEYLAAINLIETGMGRIRGLSSAGAQGPMQFLPTTWAEAGIGEGDINDPGDAIAGAARYLVRRGGPGDMAGALWGYNNSDSYVTAVQAYAELLRKDPAELAAIYNWEIYFFTDVGDIWLPTGFTTPESIGIDEFLAANPWSAPDPGLR